MNLTKDIKLEQLLHTNKDEFLEENKKTCTDEIKKNLTDLSINILQPIIDNTGIKFTITSGYRCKELNDSIGSTERSYHRFGLAADIEDTEENLKRIYDYVVENLIFAEAYIEKKGKKVWLHLADGTKGRHGIKYL